MFFSTFNFYGCVSDESSALECSNHRHVRFFHLIVHLFEKGKVQSLKFVPIYGDVWLQIKKSNDDGVTKGLLLFFEQALSHASHFFLSIKL